MSGAQVYEWSAGFNQDDMFSHCGVQNLINYALSGYACTVRAPLTLAACSVHTILTCQDSNFWCAAGLDLRADGVRQDAHHGRAAAAIDPVHVPADGAVGGEGLTVFRLNPFL